MKEDIRTDCFAYDVKHNKCECLNKTYCEFEDCRWYKSKEELDMYELKSAMKAYTANSK